MSQIVLDPLCPTRYICWRFKNLFKYLFNKNVVKTIIILQVDVFSILKAQTLSLPKKVWWLCTLPFSAPV